MQDLKNDKNKNLQKVNITNYSKYCISNSIFNSTKTGDSYFWEGLLEEKIYIPFKFT